MKTNLRFLASIGFALLFLVLSCKDKVAQPVKSAEKAITAFAFNSLSPAVTATVSGTSIAAVVPFNTDLTALAPTITSSTKATVSPASGTAQNFTNPVTYTVTTEDGTKQTYTVTVTVTKAPAPTITSFIPTTAVEGTKVVLIGTGFSAKAADNLIKFGTVSAVTDSASTTRLVTSVPKGATTGNITITVGGQTATSTSNFTVNAAPVAVGPTVANGPIGGTSLDIIGSTTATLGGNILKSDGSAVTQYGHVWSETNQLPTVADSKTELGKPNGTFPVIFTSNIKDLKANTTYYTRAYATSTSGTGYSGVVTIKTKAPPAAADVLKLDKVVNISHNGITCFGTLGYNRLPGFGTSQLYNDTGVYIIVSDSKKEPTMNDNSNFLERKMESRQSSVVGDYYTFSAVAVDRSDDAHRYLAGKTYYTRLYVKKADGTALYSNVIAAFQPKSPGNAPSVYTEIKTFTVNDILYAYNRDNMWKYNLQSNTWLAPELNFKFGSNDGEIRDGKQDDVQANGSKIYAVTDDAGSFGDPSKGFTVYEYDFSTKASKKLKTNSDVGTVTAPGGGGQNFVLTGQKLYIRSFNSVDRKSYLWIYDLAANSFTKSGEIPTDDPRSDLILTFFHAHDQTLAVYNPRKVQKYTYNIATKTWSAASSVSFYQTLSNATRGGATGYAQVATATSLFVLTNYFYGGISVPPGAALGRYTVASNSLTTLPILPDDMRSLICSYGNKVIYLETNHADGTFNPKVIN